MKVRKKVYAGVRSIQFKGRLPRKRKKKKFFGAGLLVTCRAKGGVHRRRHIQTGVCVRATSGIVAKEKPSRGAQL